MAIRFSLLSPPTDTWEVLQDPDGPALGRVECVDSRDLNTKVYAAWPHLRTTRFYARRLRADEL